ncbi:hypothetical protein JCM11491_002466 [Sporobolomyces phaffii]
MSAVLNHSYVKLVLPRSPSQRLTLDRAGGLSPRSKHAPLASRAPPPRVVQHARELLEYELAKFPDQFAEGEAWLTRAQRELDTQIDTLDADAKRRGRAYLEAHPHIAEELRVLKDQLYALKGESERRFDKFLDSHSSRTAVAHSFGRQDFHGPGRTALVYGPAAVQRAGDAHERLRERY